MIVHCENCKEELEITPYFFNVYISDHISPVSFDERYYNAHTDIKTICPNCGLTIEKSFCSEIYRETIIKLALGERQ